MEIRELVPGYAVSPQIEPGDLDAVAAAGFGTVICNRPDGENPPDRQSDAMRAAAEAAGLSFVFNPVTPGQLSADNVAMQGQTIATADKPVFAYCASGNRSSIVWALSQAGTRDTGEMIEAAGKWGYQLEPYREAIDGLARS